MRALIAQTSSSTSMAKRCPRPAGSVTLTYGQINRAVGARQANVFQLAGACHGLQVGAPKRRGGVLAPRTSSNSLLLSQKVVKARYPRDCCVDPVLVPTCGDPCSDRCVDHGAENEPGYDTDVRAAHPPLRLHICNPISEDGFEFV